MATYYKYAERNADNYIDWNSVGKEMSDMLSETNRIREEQKAALDENSRQYGLTLANAPVGESEAARAYALRFADNASNFMKMQDRLLKSGQLKMKDYLIGRQNLMDDTDNAFGALTDYQKMYKDKMERAKTDKSAAWELEGMKHAEQFGDFSRSDLYINPTNGRVSTAMKDENGKFIGDPNTYQSVSSLRGLLLGKWDKFNTNAATDAFAKTMGKYTETLSKGGMILKVSDILNRKDSDIGKKFLDYETQAINGILANDFNRLSVLTDSKKFADDGEQYRFTYDETDAKAHPESAILMVMDNTTKQFMPKFSKEQMNASTEWLRNEARVKYDRETTGVQKQEYHASEAERQGALSKKAYLQEANIIGHLYDGDDSQVANAVQHFGGFGSIQNITRTSNGVDIIYKDGSQKTYTMPENISRNDFIRGITPYLLGEEASPYIDEMVKNSKKGNLGKFNETAVSKSSTIPGLTKEQLKQKAESESDAKKREIFTNRINSSDLSNIVNKTESEAVPKLVAKFAGTGFTFEESGGGSYVTITAPDGKTEIEVSLNGDYEENKSAEETIKEFIVGNQSYKSWQNINIPVGGNADIQQRIKTEY